MEAFKTLPLVDVKDDRCDARDPSLFLRDLALRRLVHASASRFPPAIGIYFILKVLSTCEVALYDRILVITNL